MKPGRLVVCINNEKYKDNDRVITPKLAPTIYTVRIIQNCSCGCGVSCIFLEELINKRQVLFFITEIGYDTTDFRELQNLPEISLEDLLRKEVEA